ncbi:MAG: hypothetical protein IRZ03_18810 [Acidobacterium ailaaui]|nr:hypothetical protein [Pseudacidobacterium ailaaui]
MDAIDTGVRCHDGEPIVKVNAILDRIDAREFYQEELKGKITEKLLERELVIA